MKSEFSCVCSLFKRTALIGFISDCQDSLQYPLIFVDGQRMLRSDFRCPHMPRKTFSIWRGSTVTGLFL